MTTTTETTTAQTIYQQIPFWTKAALGMRDFMYDENTLYFKMTGTRAVRASVRYNAASDLYTLRCWTVRNLTETVRYEANEIDAGQLVQILDMIDRGRIEL
jgi:hypothetical protein